MHRVAYQVVQAYAPVGTAEFKKGQGAVMDGTGGNIPFSWRVEDEGGARSAREFMCDPARVIQQ